MTNLLALYYITNVAPNIFPPTKGLDVPLNVTNIIAISVYSDKTNRLTIYQSPWYTSTNNH